MIDTVKGFIGSFIFRTLLIILLLTAPARRLLLNVIRAVYFTATKNWTMLTEWWSIDGWRNQAAYSFMYYSSVIAYAFTRKKFAFHCLFDFVAFINAWDSGVASFTITLNKMVEEGKVDASSFTSQWASKGVMQEVFEESINHALEEDGFDR